MAVPSPAKTKLAGRFPPLSGRKIFPGQPCSCGGGRGGGSRLRAHAGLRHRPRQRARRDPVSKNARQCTVLTRTAPWRSCLRSPSVSAQTISEAPRDEDRWDTVPRDPAETGSARCRSRNPSSLRLRVRRTAGVIPSPSFVLPTLLCLRLPIFLLGFLKLTLRKIFFIPGFASRLRDVYIRARPGTVHIVIF